jgi:hypothetical protein
MDQIAIMLTGVTAVFLSQSKSERLRKYACIFGLIGQPFWFYATWQAEQYGIFALCFLYTFSWARGAWNFWLLPWLANRRQAIIGAALDEMNRRTAQPTGSASAPADAVTGQGET